MAEYMPTNVLAQLEAQAQQDPHLPHPEPTEPFWQLPPHPTMSEVHSEALSIFTDFAIIGSGVTGCSIATKILEHTDPQASSVTALEARSLTSDATGRNGGLLSYFVPIDYKALSERLGQEKAIGIANFADRTLDKMHALGNSTTELKSASGVRSLRSMVGWT